MYNRREKNISCVILPINSPILRRLNAPGHSEEFYLRGGSYLWEELQDGVLEEILVLAKLYPKASALLSDLFASSRRASS